MSYHACPFTDADTLHILIDSASVEKLLDAENVVVKRLLSYYNSSKLFEFERWGYSNLPVLKQIPEVKVVDDGRGTNLVDMGKRRILFSYRMEDVEKVAETVYNKSIVEKEELSAVMMVFAHKTLFGLDGYRLILTANPTLLSRALWFGSHFPGGILNIVSPDETAQRMDLFAKVRGEYHVANNQAKVDQGYWYLLSFRSKIRHYDISNDPDESLASRFKFLLFALDQMGVQYYTAANNETMDNTLYHFNYFVSLTSGVFDSLAEQSRIRLRLDQFDPEKEPWKISLYKGRRARAGFRQAIGAQRPSLANHIEATDSFIELVRRLRNSIIHREGLKHAFVLNRDPDNRWEGNFIQMPKDTAQDITKYERENNNEFSVGPFVSPYHFAKALAKSLIEFTEKYLELLGSIRASLGGNDLDKFEEGRLGF